MKAKELIEFLQANPELDVILQKDAEGNWYSPLAGFDADAVYVPDSTGGGDVYSTNWTADEAATDETEWEEIKAKPRCIVLFPVN